MVRKANVEARRQMQSSKERSQVRQPDTTKSKNSFGKLNYLTDEKGRSNSKRPRSREQFYKDMMDHKNFVDKKVNHMIEEKKKAEKASVKSRPEINSVSKAIVNYSKYIGGVLSTRKKVTNRSTTTQSNNSSKLQNSMDENHPNLVNLDLGISPKLAL